MSNCPFCLKEPCVQRWITQAWKHSQLISSQSACDWCVNSHGSMTEWYHRGNQKCSGRGGDYVPMRLKSSRPDWTWKVVQSKHLDIHRVSYLSVWVFCNLYTWVLYTYIYKYVGVCVSVCVCTRACTAILMCYTNSLYTSIWSYPQLIYKKKCSVNILHI